MSERENLITKKSESFEEDPCVVCFRECKYFSVGECDHPVCFECSTRMRVLCRQNECPICRQEAAKVKEFFFFLQ